METKRGEIKENKGFHKIVVNGNGLGMITRLYTRICCAFLSIALVVLTHLALSPGQNNSPYSILNIHTSDPLNQSAAGAIPWGTTPSNSSLTSSLNVSHHKVKLTDLVDLNSFKVKADVSDLIDFAIVGNPKTGTTFMVEWMRTHPDLLLPADEMRAMLKGHEGAGKAITSLYPLIDARFPPQQVGYKCPADIRETTALKNLRDFFSNTKLIIGLRHPVWWFQSFYNYRVRNEISIPLPMESRGPCRKEHWKVCTFNAYFHMFLAQLGQTPMSPEELSLLRRYDPQTLSGMPINFTFLNPPARHDVFIYEQVQMDGVKFPKISEAFRHDLSKYLELNSPLISLRDATQLSYHDAGSSRSAPVVSMMFPFRVSLNTTGADLLDPAS